MTTEDEISTLRNAEAKLQAVQSYFAAIGNFVSTGERVIMTDKLNEAMREIQKLAIIKEYNNNDKKYTHTNGVAVSKASA